MSNNKILVTGGSGFLGSHVADALTEAGFRVSIFDRKKSPWLSESQEMIIGDILDDKLIIDAVKDKFAVFHFAGIADIQKANEYPLNSVKYNVLGTTGLLEACSKEKVSRFIFSSSVYVYSESGGFYRTTKQACELLIENYQKLKGLDYTILRFGSLYGRRSNKYNWINNIIHQALTEGKMERQGDGEEIRDYIHVSDAAKACVSILDEEYKNTYLMLTGLQAIKVKDLLRMIREILNKKVEIKFLKEQIDEHYEITPYSFRPRIAHKLNQPIHTDLGQGILDTIYDVYKEINKNAGNTVVDLPEQIKSTK